MITIFKQFESNMDNLFLGQRDAEEWCREYRIYNATVHADGTVDVHGHVDLAYESMTRIPVRFGAVAGNFDCSNGSFESLVGAPRSVDGNFYCSGNGKMRTLEHGPERVGGDYGCWECGLESLRGAPKVVHGKFDCSLNDLRDLSGAPDVVIHMKATRNVLESMAGAPADMEMFMLSGEMARYGLRYLAIIRELPREFKRSLPPDNIRAYAARKDPELAPLLFPDGNVPEFDNDSVGYFSAFL